MVLGFLIGAECGFMGSDGGVLMLMVLTMLMGMDTKLAVGTSSLVMTLVALTGAVSHLAMQSLNRSLLLLSQLPAPSVQLALSSLPTK